MTRPAVGDSGTGSAPGGRYADALGPAGPTGDALAVSARFPTALAGGSFGDSLGQPVGDGFGDALGGPLGGPPGGTRGAADVASTGDTFDDTLGSGFGRALGGAFGDALAAAPSTDVLAAGAGGGAGGGYADPLSATTTVVAAEAGPAQGRAGGAGAEPPTGTGATTAAASVPAVRGGSTSRRGRARSAPARAGYPRRGGQPVAPPLGTGTPGTVPMRRPTSRPAHAAPGAGARIRKGRLLVFLLVMVVLFGNVVRNCVSDHADRSGAQPRPPAVTSPR